MRISGICRKSCWRPYFLAVFLGLLSTGNALGASGEGGGVTVIPDGSLIIQIVNFIFTIWVLNLLLYRPIRKILLQRKEKIKGLELSIETADNDIKEKNEAFAARIKAARTKGLREKEDLMQTAAEEEKKIIESINKKAQEELAEIREKIARDAEIARETLRNQLDEFAEDISKKILGRAV